MAVHPASDTAPAPDATPLIRNLPSLIVRKKNGVGYCADHISSCIHEGYHCLSFISSGGLVILRADDVAAVEYCETGRTWCNQCDGAIQTWTAKAPPEWTTPGPEVLAENG